MPIPRHLTALLLASAFLLGGCASRGPLPTFYDFGPVAPQAAAQPAAPAVPMLVIAEANGPSWLDSQRMYTGCCTPMRSSRGPMPTTAGTRRRCSC